MRRARILVLQMKRIGDLILTAPAIADLREAFPEAEIVMVVAGNCVDLAECFPGVTQVLRYDTGRVNAALWAAVSVGGWDVCLDFTGTDRAALLTQLSGAKERVGYRKFCGKRLRARAYTTLCEASVRELHTVAFHRALVAEVGAKKGGDKEGAVFGFKAGTRERLAQVMRERGVRERYAIVHPGTARREKFWMAERWVEVVRYLKGAGCQVVMTGTGVGLEAEDVAMIRAEEGVVDLTGKLALSELAALMQGARVAIGVDSMAMHLAAMWKVPQVVLFGPTNPFHWRPLHERVVVLVGGRDGNVTVFEPRMKGGEMGQITVKSVESAVSALLEV